jgi:hypothetical protein
MAAVALGGCGERLTLCHCVLLDYASETRRGPTKQEAESASRCECDAERKRTEERSPYRERGDPDNPSESGPKESPETALERP